MTTTNSKIVIVGAGVFGLSTALHLKYTGYQDVTVFDYQPYDQNGYDSGKGCDSASSDVNKIYRCSYGSEVEYQDLADSGRPIWEEWNKQIASTPASELPKGLTQDTQVFLPCGLIRFSLLSELSEYEKRSIEEMQKAGLGEDQYVIGDKKDMERLRKWAATRPGEDWDAKIRLQKTFLGGKQAAFLDSGAGLTYADKACAWARHLCEQSGVKFILGPSKGRLQELILDAASSDKQVRGIVTADGLRHEADVTVVACGGWTPGVIPEVEGLLQTTAGSVVTIQIPPERKDLWHRFAPENFAVWSYGVTSTLGPEDSGYYGFPRTPEGKIKIGYRGRKWTNYQAHPKTGKRLSVPTTRYTDQKTMNLPKKALDLIKKHIEAMFPELTEIGIIDTRMCWYTDSIDNSFVIDYVPGYNKSLFVASGGSGHGFKFLPVLGKHVVNQLEGKHDQFTPIWKWRSTTEGGDANGLDEGESSGRNLADLVMATTQDWSWTAANNAIALADQVKGALKL